MFFEDSDDAGGCPDSEGISLADVIHHVKHGITILLTPVTFKEVGSEVMNCSTM